MKLLQILIPCLLLQGGFAFEEEPAPEVVKLVEKQFDSIEGVSTPELGKLSHKDWLAEVSAKGWTLLQSAERDEFHFAVFRKDDQLAFWETCKIEGSIPAGGFNIEAVKDEESAQKQERAIKMMKELSLIYKYKAPDGQISSGEWGKGFLIDPKFIGEINITRYIETDEGEKTALFNEDIAWRGAKKAESGR
jgi:hypothetical protein